MTVANVSVMPPRSSRSLRLNLRFIHTPHAKVSQFWVFCLVLSLIMSLGIPKTQAAVSCRKGLKPPFSQSIKVSLPAKVRAHFDPEKGDGKFVFDTSPALSAEVWMGLYMNVPKTGTFEIITNGQKVENESARFVPPDYLKAVEEHADHLLKNINQALGPQEQLQIEVLRLAISDGFQSQLNEDWHIDSLRYMTVISNLMGAGTLYDLELPQPVANGIQRAAPKTHGELPAGKTIILNGWLRQMLMPGPGSNPLLHRAPDGLAMERLSIVMFLTPVGMNSPEVSGQLRRNELGAEDLRKLYLRGEK